MFVFFGGLLVLALFVALIGPYFVDWSSYRHDFEREASRILGQKVQVLGSAEARLVPFPSVTFENVVVGEGQDGKPMMTVDRFSMDAELAPFLSGEIRIFDMRIENPQATVRLSPEGELDWALRSEKSLPGGALILENIGVVNGQVLVLDEQNDREYRLAGLNMHMSAKSILGPWSIDGAVRADGIDTAFTLQTGALLPQGGIRLRAKLLPVAQPFSIEMEGDARIEDLKPRYSGNFLLRALDPAKTVTEEAVKGNRSRKPIYLKARGVFELDNERLRIEDYRLETGSPKDPYVISGEATFDTGREPEFLLIADGQQLNFDRLDEAEDESPSDAVVRSFEQRLTALRGLLTWAPVPQMPGRVSVALPAIVAGDTTIRDVLIDAHPDGNAWKIDRVQAKLPGRTQFEAKGQLGVGSDFTFSGDMVLASNQPSGFASWLTTDVDPAIRRLDAAGISAKVDLSAQLQRFDQMEIALGAAVLSGQIQRVVPTQGRPSLNMRLDGEFVDLDAIRAFTTLVVGEGDGNRLAGHDISARLSAKRFEALGMMASGADLSVRLKGGTLDIDRLTVTDVAGVSISSVGRVENVFEGPEGEVDVSVMAERIDDIVALSSRLTDGHPLLDHLQSKAALFGETNFDLHTRFVNRPGETAMLTATAQGETGGSKFDLSIERSDALAPLSTGQMSVTAEIESNDPQTLLGQMGIQLLPLDLAGPATVDMKIDGVPTEQLEFAFNYEAPDTSAAAEGIAWQDHERSIKAAFDLNLNSEDLAPYLLSNGIMLAGPASALPVELKALVDTGSGQIELKDMEGRAGEISYAGNLALSRGDTTVSANGAVSVSEMDLGWMAEMMLGFDTILTGEPTWSDQEFLPPTQTGVSIDLDLRADSADLHLGPTARNWSGKLVLQDNELQWRDMQADWLNGSLTGGARLANRDGSGFLSGQVQVEGAQLGPLVWQRDGFPVATGSFDLSSTFEGAGKSLRAIVASLTGSGVLEIAGLELDGVENESLVQILAAADADGFEVGSETVTALAEQAVSDGSFYAGEASAPFTIAAGTVRLPNVTLSDNGATIRGEARLDVADQAINARFDVEFDPEDEALTGAAPSVNLAFLGPVSDPDRSVDAAELSNFLSLRAYERERRRVETLQAVVLENQRLRREVALAKQRAETRQRTLERLRQEEAERAAEEEASLEEQRLERREQDEEARLKAEREAAEREAEERRARIEREERELAESRNRAAQIVAEWFAQNGSRPPTNEEYIQQVEDAIRQAGERDSQPVQVGAGDSTGRSVVREPLPRLQFDALGDATGSTE